jgi:hypothetical protein
MDMRVYWLRTMPMIAGLRLEFVEFQLRKLIDS